MRLKPAALAFALLCTAAPQAYAQAAPAAEAPAAQVIHGDRHASVATAVGVYARMLFGRA